LLTFQFVLSSQIAHNS